MRAFLQSIAAEPAVPNPPARGWRDGVLVGVSLVAAVLEGVFRPDLPWRWASLAVGLVAIPTLLWRRTNPLAMVIVAFTAVIALDVARLIAGTKPLGLYSMVVLIVLPYALTRWASGRHMLIALPVILTSATISVVFDYGGVAESIIGFLILFGALELGWAVRSRVGSRARAVEEIKLREREHLARELHDTVAHHVSAMAIRAQAGLAAADSRPAAALEALRVIESEASRALAEMRTMVRVLRQDVPAEMAPTPQIPDIAHLAHTSTAGPPVAVTIDGDLTGITSAVGTAVYRLAQEAVTNARRHSRRATTIDVAVSADADLIRLRVHDDGAPTVPAAQGYGLVGMAERAALIGGTCHAGPDPAGGWTVTAEVPRNGAGE